MVFRKWRGTAARAPFWNAGFPITGLHYTKDLLKTLYQERLAEDGSGFPESSMTMAELNYTLRPTPWLGITPNLQYVWHPDGLGALTYPSTNLRNARVIGTQVEVK
jgi:porin